MKLKYKLLLNKYLRFFKSKEHCDFVLTDVLFAFKEIYPFLNHKNINKILEIGSGTGILLKELSEYFPKKFFFGLDPHKTGFHGYERISSNISNKNLSLYRVSLKNFKNKFFFDLIFSFNTFEHIKNQDQYLMITKDLLSDRGKKIIFCPNYDFPYEPHFKLPILFNKKITYFFFRNIIRNYERKTKEYGLWKNLNLNGKKKIESLLIKNKLNFFFDNKIYDKILNRITDDESKFFKKRQFMVSKLALFLRTIFFDKLIFNFFKFPFPYMKIIITKK